MMKLYSEEMRRNPFPVYDQVRSTSPLLHDPRSDFWMIFDYDGVKRALNDHAQLACQSASSQAGELPRSDAVQGCA
jgi:cytochrome P450